MAIFHLTAKVVSRGRGQSAVAKAAYNSRSKIEQERTGIVNDYSRKEGLEFSGIFAPKDAPEWARDRAQLWNEVERVEKRKDAQLAREIEVALPHELNAEQRRQLITDFVREQFMRKGMVADVNIHAPDRQGDERNYHAHILLTMREIGPDGFGPKVREWNSREQLEKWREGWERTANRYLERHGFEPSLDRRTLEAQGIDREPTKHRGVNVQGMERRGLDTERGNIHRDTVSRNAELRALKADLREVESELAVVARGIGRVAEIGVTAALKPLEVIASIFDKPRELTPGEVQARKEDVQEKIDVARFRKDADYRAYIRAQTEQQLEREREQRKTYERQQERDDRQR